MITNQALATALNGLVVLAADRKKVSSVTFQEDLVLAMGNIADELTERGIELKTITIRNPEHKGGSWDVPFLEEGNLSDGISRIINVPGLIP